MGVDILDLLWRSFGSRWLTLALLSSIIVVVALGAILPQMPEDIAVGSPEYSAWHADVQARYLQWANRLSRLGLLSIRDSLWLRIPLALLVVNLLICAVDRFLAASRPQVPIPQRFAQAVSLGSPSRSLLFVGDMDSASAKLHELMKLHHYTFEAQETNGDTHLTARRFTCSRWGVLLGHLGLIVMIVSVILGGRLAWRERDIVLGPGQEYHVQHAASLSVRLDDFVSDLHPQGEGQSSKASVTILENGTEVKRGVVSPGLPLQHNGMFLYQVSHGPLIRIKATDAEDSAISLQTLGSSGALLEEASLQLSDEENEGYVAVPERDLVLRVVLQTEPVSETHVAPTLLLQAYREGTTDVIFSATLPHSGSVEVEQDSYAVEWGHYAVLGIISDPSLGPLLLGAVTLLIGTTFTILVRPRCIHAVVRGKEGVVEIGLAYAGEDAKGAGGHEFETLAAEVKEACRGS